MDEPRITAVPAVSQLPASRLPVRSISLALVVMMVVYAGMATQADWAALGAAASALPAALWAQLALLSLLSYLLRFARWHRFIAALGHHVPGMRNLEIYLAAFALTLTPGKAGETIRSVYLHRYGVSYPHSIAAFVSERLLDLLAVGGMASLAITIFPEQQHWMLAAIACILISVFLLRSRLLALIGKRLARGAAPAAKAVATIRFLLSGRRLAVATALSLMAWAAQGISLYLIVHALGYQLPASTVIAIYCLSILAGAASFIPGGLGATEAAIVLLLSATGVSQADAIIASLINRSLTLWLAISIGVMAMTRTILLHQPTRSPPLSR
ncbi:flippase-like domain-containing protein [Massilia sp. MB5]|uniref:lysylphosphatidylglycerol synthase transmembrane domain-containing protein n=1 Tax=Massilia sp. MB5 TaxID=2919578 RepID=UPI001F0EE934|nr:lysylphosphatidylglycerol synthase transmembrane domain-containing protein [Massilia sp. MB5]UMR32518.1 flippase-like domain-containing protein [Massilia sp. MB5]